MTRQCSGTHLVGEIKTLRSGRTVVVCPICHKKLAPLTSINARPGKIRRHNIDK